MVGVVRGCEEVMLVGEEKLYEILLGLFCDTF
jgi:hypothetical protein